VSPGVLTGEYGEPSKDQEPAGEDGKDKSGKDVKVGYLHDSRARTLTEAIVWHGGEGKASRDRFIALSKTDREALLAFLGSL